MASEKILEVKDLVIDFKTDNGILHAVRNISFDLYKGETLCIVGESGSGKSVTSKAIMGILAANSIVQNGSIMYEGENLLEVSEEEFHRIRGHKIGMIFQDPLSSLNPIVRIGDQITEAMLINSNRLKEMYNELISKELVAYKNIIAKKNIAIKHEKDKYQLFLANAKAEIAKNPASKVEQQAAIAKAKEEMKAEVAKITLEANAKLPEAKKALNEAKAAAREKVNTFKAEEDARFKAYEIDWKERMSHAKASLDQSALDSLVHEKEEYVSKYNDDLNNIIAKINEQIADANNKGQKGRVMELNAQLSMIKKEKADELKEYNNQWKKRYKEAEVGPEVMALVNEYKTKKEEHIAKTKITKAEAKKKALEVMREVGIPLPEKRFRQYPFEFSGGMRQRIVIAIALTAAPDILICDEPTTALDVTIQAQILELIKKIQAERNISCIFITHDLGVVANMADRVAVMYAGKIVEHGLVDEIFFDPKHPYTWALLSSIPDVDSKERLDAIPGTPPNMIYPPVGDAFAARNKYALKIDFEKQPPYFKVTDTHYAATWLLHPSAPKVEMPAIVKERIKNALAGVNATNNEELEQLDKKSSKGGKKNE